MAILVRAYPHIKPLTAGSTWSDIVPAIPEDAIKWELINISSSNVNFTYDRSPIGGTLISFPLNAFGSWGDRISENYVPLEMWIQRTAGADQNLRLIYWTSRMMDERDRR